VRIIRLWEVPNYNNPNVVDSIELLLVDGKGSRIQASIRNTIMQRFSNTVKEGSCRIIAKFGLISNIGNIEPLIILTNSISFSRLLSKNVKMCRSLYMGLILHQLPKFLRMRLMTQS
ncbi:Nitrogenase molybdenum-iron protein alpha chain, partial [Bienertia sinuspersici]